MLRHSASYRWWRCARAAPVMELMEGGNLYNVMHGSGVGFSVRHEWVSTQQKQLTVSLDTVSSMVYLHD